MNICGKFMFKRRDKSRANNAYTGHCLLTITRHAHPQRCLLALITNN